jgi:hypothetical protein
MATIPMTVPFSSVTGRWRMASSSTLRDHADGMAGVADHQRADRFGP